MPKWSYHFFRSKGICMEFFVTQLFSENKIWRRQRQNLYADHYSKNLFEAITQFLGNIGCFLQFQGAGKHKTVEKHRTIYQKRCTVLQVKQQATWIINVPFSNHLVTSVRGHRFKAIVWLDFGAVYDCYIVDISKSRKKNFHIIKDVR